MGQLDVSSKTENVKIIYLSCHAELEASLMPTIKQ